ncbi:uncharacterized protein LOC110841874 [Folsomia candida]|uniref:Zinc metalloprotease ZmpB n=1 Tax=Folsomia candida TaxID=158441 RepID=A0A226F280_FOLCA|nr:uncharacterized protein LOC110841874 [Folsomia candida]OXA63905.1 Zinc metalloprotease ZmpB [Folsomia candida]
MKTALILLVVMVAFAAARTLNDKQAVDKGFLLPCGRHNVGKTYTYPFSPSKYFECTQKGLELRKCGHGTWYSSDAKACIRNEDSGECDPISESEEPSESVEVEPTEPAPESEESVEIEPTEPAPESEESVEIEPTEPAPESSESVEVEPTEPAPESSESVEVEPTEPAPESSESVEIEPTDPPASSSSEEVSEPCKIECAYHGEYLVNPASCNSFYQCSWGVAYLHQCPNETVDGSKQLVFDPNLDVCVWSKDYECTGEPGCQQPEPEPECPAVVCETLGQYIPNPADCHSFYQCSWGAGETLFPYYHNCPLETDTTRLVFDPTLNVCNWSSEVECKTSC